MISHRLLSHTAGKTSRSGFTLVELLVVIGIIAILAGVALGPITNGIKKAQQSAALQNARTIAISCFQYSNDNNGIYPDGADAGAIAEELIDGKYVSDPKLFTVTGDPKLVTFTGVASNQNPVKANNISFDFTGVNGSGSTTTYAGYGSSAPDQLPVVWTGGETVQYPAAGAGYAFTPQGNGPFGKDGIAIAYKSNSAIFSRPNPNPNIPYPPKGEVDFIDQSFDPGTTTYAERIGDNL